MKFANGLPLYLYQNLQDDQADLTSSVDIEDAENPKEIAYYVPETPKRKPRKIAAGRYEMLQTQIDDVFVAKNELVYITERMGAGIYILEPDF